MLIRFELVDHAQIISLFAKGVPILLIENRGLNIGLGRQSYLFSRLQWVDLEHSLDELEHY